MSGARRWPALLAVALIFAAALARVSGFFTDDSYIHLVFARSFSRGEAFCFNAGQPVYGFTSPLWMLLLAGGHAFVGDWHATARLLGLGFTLLAVLATFRLARAAGGSPGAAFGAAATLALHAWFLRWSLSGMETSLAAFLVAAGLERLLRGPRSAPVGLVLLSLAALARPEALILFGAACVWAIARGPMRPIGTGHAAGAIAPGHQARAMTRAPVVAGALIGAGLLLAWGIWAHAVTRAWIPTAYTVKRFHEAVTLGGSLHDAAYFLGVVGITDAALAVAVTGSLWILWRRGERPGAAGLLLLWPTLLAAFYLGARVQMISRYWVPALPAMCASAWVLSERALGPRTRFLWVALYFAQQAAVLLLLVGPQIDAFTRGLNGGPVEMGRWLRANSARGALVATPDIGAIGFYSERAVLDLGGLVTPEMAPVLAHHDIHEVVAGALYEAVGRPDYLVDRADRPGELSGQAEIPGRPRYELVCVSRIENLGLSRPRPQYYSLYEVISAEPR